MIPLHLALSGFLSYREAVEIDFTTFDLACIAGPNGAGKSSLLDAITWALFGVARRSDESIINAQSKEASVSFTFTYEETVYRVLRIKVRDKSTLLEFQIRQAPASPGARYTWKPLSERTLRDTQARIDYETFVTFGYCPGWRRGRAGRSKGCRTPFSTERLHDRSSPRRTFPAHEPGPGSQTRGMGLDGLSNIANINLLGPSPFAF
jgi:hypothetical protein